MIRVGEKLKNGATVLAFKSKYKNEYIVLAEWDNNGHEYVVWRADEEGNCYSGYYSMDRDRAEKLYEGRN